MPDPIKKNRMKFEAGGGSFFLINLVIEFHMHISNEKLKYRFSNILGTFYL